MLLSLVVYKFADNSWQDSIDFDCLFCFTCSSHRLIKLKFLNYVSGLFYKLITSKYLKALACLRRLHKIKKFAISFFHFQIWCTYVAPIGNILNVMELVFLFWNFVTSSSWAFEILPNSILNLHRWSMFVCS